jgi:hypothetical protein
MTADKNIRRRVEVMSVGHDSHGEPVARFFATHDPDGLGRLRRWVVPVTDADYVDLSERLARSETGLVEFELDQALLDLTSDMQDIREGYA